MTCTMIHIELDRERRWRVRWRALAQNGQIHCRPANEKSPGAINIFRFEYKNAKIRGQVDQCSNEARPAYSNANAGLAGGHGRRVRHCGGREIRIEADDGAHAGDAEQHIAEQAH